MSLEVISASPITLAQDTKLFLRAFIVTNLMRENPFLVPLIAFPSKRELKMFDFLVNSYAQAYVDIIRAILATGESDEYKFV